jgi:hypothetical protein
MTVNTLCVKLVWADQHDGSTASARPSCSCNTTTGLCPHKEGFDEADTHLACCGEDMTHCCTMQDALPAATLPAVPTVNSQLILSVAMLLGLV